MNIHSFVSFGAGVALSVMVFVIFLILSKRVRFQEQQKRSREFEEMAKKLEGSFATLSLEALSKNSSEFLKLAQSKFEATTQIGEKDLESKKKLIDQTLGLMKNDLKGVEELVRSLEKDRENKFAHLSANLESMTKETSVLQKTAQGLHNALANTKVRGQWGERMAEDVLRLAGFIEGINYARQKSTKEGRPDFTFFLPQNLKIHMDVKFPLNNYWRFLEVESESDKLFFKRQFLQDARNRVKEVTGKDYIDPEQRTVDYCIVFIPNEQVYAFINEHDKGLLDEALKNKVIFCSPLTLYAVLAVIRQAVDNFNLERTTDEILSVLNMFGKQWQAFLLSFEKMGTKIDEVQKEYEKLMTTRRKQLDRQIQKIETLRSQQSLLSEQDTPELVQQIEADIDH